VDVTSGSMQMILSSATAHIDGNRHNRIRISMIQKMFLSSTTKIKRTVYRSIDSTRTAKKKDRALLYRVIAKDTVNSISCWCTSVGKPFYGVLPPYDVHERYTRDLPDSSSQFTVTRRDDVAFVSSNSLDKAVIGVGAGMRTVQAFEAGISGYPRGRRGTFSN
jgi:hypothetical protein